VKIISQISTMMHETWVGTKNYQTMRFFCVDHSLPTPYTYHLQMGEDAHQGEL
jgi:hypothetical protein